MCPNLIEIGSKTAEKNSAQTNRHTDRQTHRHYENNGHLAVNQKTKTKSGSNCMLCRCVKMSLTLPTFNFCYWASFARLNGAELNCKHLSVDLAMQVSYVHCGSFLLIVICIIIFFAFSALTLLVGWQKGHLACKNEW